MLNVKQLENKIMHSPDDKTAKKMSSKKGKKASLTNLTKEQKDYLRQQKFKGDGVLFKAKMIGIEDVSEARGDRMCQESMQRLKAAAKSAGEHKQRITLSITLTGIRIIDERSGIVEHTHPVHQISFISRDPSDNRAFGYVFGAEGSHKFFAIKTEKASENVVLTLKDLFQAVFDMKTKEMEDAKKQQNPDVLYLKPMYGDDENTTEAEESTDPSTGEPTYSVPSSEPRPLENGINLGQGNIYADPAELVPPPESEPQTQAAGNLVDLENELKHIQMGIDAMEAFGDPFSAGTTSPVESPSGNKTPNPFEPADPFNMSTGSTTPTSSDLFSPNSSSSMGSPPISQPAGMSGGQLFDPFQSQPGTAPTTAAAASSTGFASFGEPNQPLGGAFQQPQPAFGQTSTMMTQPASQSSMQMGGQSSMQMGGMFQSSAPAGNMMGTTPFGPAPVMNTMAANMNLAFNSPSPSMPMSTSSYISSAPPPPQKPPPKPDPFGDLDILGKSNTTNNNTENKPMLGAPPSRAPPPVPMTGGAPPLPTPRTNIGQPPPPPTAAVTGTTSPMGDLFGSDISSLGNTSDSDFNLPSPDVPPPPLPPRKPVTDDNISLVNGPDKSNTPPLPPRSFVVKGNKEILSNPIPIPPRTATPQSASSSSPSSLLSSPQLERQARTVKHTTPQPSNTNTNSDLFSTKDNFSSVSSALSNSVSSSVSSSACDISSGKTVSPSNNTNTTLSTPTHTTQNTTQNTSAYSSSMPMNNPFNQHDLFSSMNSMSSSVPTNAAPTEPSLFPQDDLFSGFNTSTSLHSQQTLTDTGLPIHDDPFADDPFSAESPTASKVFVIGTTKDTYSLSSPSVPSSSSVGNPFATSDSSSKNDPFSIGGSVNTAGTTNNNLFGNNDAFGAFDFGSSPTAAPAQPASNTNAFGGDAFDPFGGLNEEPLYATVNKPKK